jgi:hypothetical protein
VSGVSRWRESPNLERPVQTAGGEAALAAAVSAMLDETRIARAWGARGELDLAGDVIRTLKLITDLDAIRTVVASRDDAP